MNYIVQFIIIDGSPNPRKRLKMVKNCMSPDHAKAKLISWLANSAEFRHIATQIDETTYLGAVVFQDIRPAFTDGDQMMSYFKELENEISRNQ